MAEGKTLSKYRLTRASILWIVAFFALVPYEIYMVRKGIEGGPLTHVVKWCYGPQFSLRWWLLGLGNSGFLLWMVPHFLFEGVGFRALCIFILAGMAIGLVGYFIHH